MDRSPSPERAALEAEVRRLCDAGEHEAATTAAIRGYGPELLGFLAAVMQNRQDAGDVFAMTCEDLWRGVPAFEWRSSLRTWAYTIARNAAHRFRAEVARRGERVPLSEVSAISRLAVEVREATLPHLDTAVRGALARFRAALDPDDQMLLVLRLDRDMAWPQVARVFLGDRLVSDAALEREAAALRQRFARIKERLRGAVGKA